MRLADDFKVRPDPFIVRLGHHVVRHSHSFLVRLDIDVQDQLLQQLELLPILIHPHQLLEYMLRYILIPELPSNDRRTQMPNKFLLQFLFYKESVYVSKKVVDFRNLQAKLDGNFDGNFVNGGRICAVEGR